MNDFQSQLNTAQACIANKQPQAAIIHFQRALELTEIAPLWVYHKLAQQLFLIEDFTAASKVFNTLISHYPHKHHGYEGLAATAQKQQQWDLALERWQICFNKFPQRPIYWLTPKANALLALEQFSAAETVFQELIKTYPDKANGYEGLASIAQRQQQWTLALERWQICFNKFPQRPIYWLTPKANALLALAQFTAAEPVFQELIKTYPDKANGYEGLASIAQRQQQWTLALERWQICFNKFSQRPIYWLTPKANALLALEQFSAAETVFTSILAQDETNFNALFGLARIARKTNQRPQALKLFSALAKLHPDRIQPYLEIATELREQANFEAALEQLQQCQQQFPEHFAVYVQQGILFREQRQFTQALQALQHAVKLAPTETQVQLELTLIQFNLGQIKTAITNLQALLQQQPQQLGALLRLSAWLLQAQQTDLAFEYLQYAIKQHPKQLQPYLSLAQAYLSLSDTKNCLVTLNQAQDLLGSQADIYHLQIKALWLQRQIKTAQSTQQQALKLFPNDYNLQLQQLKFQLELGQFSKVQHSIAKVSQTTATQSLKLQLLRAEINQQQWYLATAREQYLAILKTSAHCISAHEALRILGILQLDFKLYQQQVEYLQTQNLGFKQLAGTPRAQLHDHYAQLVDEYLLNPEVLVDLQATLKLPIRTRLETLSKIMQLEPDSTATAITLLVQLRQAGYFDRLNAVGKHPIPKQIFQYWDQEKPPTELLELMQSWKTQNPAYKYQCFNDRSAQEFLHQHYTNSELKAYRNAEHVAQKADFFRLALLYKCGGIYADADDMCLQSLDNLIPQNTKLLLWQEHLATIGNNFIAVVAKHPVLKLALTAATTALLRGDNESIWLSTGPGLLSRAVGVYLAQQWHTYLPQELNLQILTKAQLFNVVGFHTLMQYKNTRKSWFVQEFKSSTRLDIAKITATIK